MTVFKDLKNVTTHVSRLAMVGVITLLTACGAAEDQAPHVGEEQSGDYERGPNRGRLLKDGAFAVEVTIFETGVPPQFRLYPYLDGAPIEPSKVDLTIELDRLGNITDHFAFDADGGYLVGRGEVVEPHSFFVRVNASYQGQKHSWSYPSYEGRTTINTKIAEESGIEVEPAGPVMLEEVIDVIGRLDLEPDAKANLRARYPGQVLAVYKTVGDKVQKGEKLARIESNSSLQAYNIVSPIDGTVLERNTNAGDVADKGDLFVVGDLTKLHVDFHIFPKDLSRVAVGQSAIINSVDDRLSAKAEIKSFLPTKELETQTVIARASLFNPDETWMPGMTVRGDIVVRKEEVPIAVRTEALQRFRDFTVVFAQVGETYEVRMLDIGRQTNAWTEVLGGIRLGQNYVSKNSFLIKADIEKSGASHDH